MAFSSTSMKAMLVAALCLVALLAQPGAASRASALAPDEAQAADAPAAAEAAAGEAGGAEKSSVDHGIVVGAADGSDDHIRAHMEVRCHNLKYTLACDLNKDCDTISCTGMAGDEILDAYTPMDAAELLQGAVDAWASDTEHVCRARETLGEGPSCIQKLFPQIAASA